MVQDAATGFGTFGDQLRFEADAFVYRNHRYAYAQVRGLIFRQEIYKGQNPEDKPRYESELQVVLETGRHVVLRPSGYFSSTITTADKAVYDTMARAAEWLGVYTFNTRMDGYEAELKLHRHTTWGHYQITMAGELFRKHAYCMNLRNEDVRCILYPFHLACLRRPKKWWKHWLTMWMKRSERVDLRRDRDCFLYFMRRHVGLNWPNETLHVYRGVAADGTDRRQQARAQAEPQANAQAGAQAGADRQVPPPPPQPKVMPTSVQHLATLGLAADARWDTVKMTYRQLAKKHHPDLLRGRGANAEVVRQSEDVLKSINEAYGWLEDFYRLKR